jgi:hypothetical protein
MARKWPVHTMCFNPIVSCTVLTELTILAILLCFWFIRILCALLEESLKRLCFSYSLYCNNGLRIPIKVGITSSLPAPFRSFDVSEA